MRMKAYFSKENLHKEWNRSNYRLLALYFLSSLLLNAVRSLTRLRFASGSRGSFFTVRT